VLGRLFRIILNSFTFVLLLIVAYVVWGGNPVLSILLALAAIDQFEDVYYYTYRRRLFPDWFRPIDMIFEMFVVGVGLGMLVFSIMYYMYFETWFFKALLFLSIPVIYSAIEDMVLWRKYPSNPSSAKEVVKELPEVLMYVCPKEAEVRQEKRFVRRKY